MAKRYHDQAFLGEDDNSCIFNPEIDVDLAEALVERDRHQEQLGGGLSRAHEPLLEFNFTPTVHRQRWRNVLHKQTFRARIEQKRRPTTSDSLGHEVTTALFRAIDREITRDTTLTPHSTVHFLMQSDQFTHAFQSTTFTVLEFRQESERVNTYLQSLAQKLNSNQEFTPNDSFTVETTFIHTPSPGSGNGNKQKPGREAIEKFLARKQTVIQIKNDDELCCARAIVTMQAWCHKDDNVTGNNYKSIRQGRPIQTRLAQALHKQAGVPFGPCGIPELQKFQEVLPEYQIKVLSADSPHCIIFEGPPAPRLIQLVKVDDHYHGCTSFGGFLSKSYYCHDCNRGYNTEDIEHHPCKGRKCLSCERKDCVDFVTAKIECHNHPQPTVPCQQCNRKFYGEDCYSYHLIASQIKYSVCDTVKKCSECCKQVRNAKTKPTHGGDRKSGRSSHKCGFHKCGNCGKIMEVATHKCFIQPVNHKDDEPRKRKKRNVQARRVVHSNEGEELEDEIKQTPLFVFADYEAVTDTDGVQTPIMVCAEDAETDETKVLYGNACSKEFLNYLDNLTRTEDGDKRDVIVVFHNFKGYDAMFILQQLFKEHRAVTHQINVGSKVLSLTSGNLKFIDSLRFLPFPLNSFPDTFGLNELKKGFFPHLFNTLENQKYEGPMPPREMYDPDSMSAKTNAEFERWYEEQVRNDYVFILRKEMTAYCISDVKLLKAGCQAFQKEFEQHGKFNPMEKCVTIASASHRYWRKMHLQTNKIAVEPARGWHGSRNNQSVKALKWMNWCEHQLRHTSPSNYTEEPVADRIAHAGNQGEHSILTPARAMHVDGYDERTRTAYEFHGCLFHGCTRCYPQRNQYSKLSPDRNMQELYEATLAKTALLRAMGYTVMEMWECDWDRKVKNDAVLGKFVSQLEIVEPLNPRDAFFGGRTNTATLYHKVDESIGEKIKYVDVTSMYPWVNKYGEYPVGHPEIVTNPEDLNIQNYFGLAKVDVLPPSHLYHPVLPYRWGGKLVLPLCRSCVEKEMSESFLNRSCECSHTPEQRMLRGTWCTPELAKAVELGYTIVHIHEVWHFPESQRQKGLFASYVNKWLKIKQESGGYPSWVRTEEDKARYVREYKEHEGIQLDPTMIRKNPGRKATAKLMLNSFWGKFGERMNKPRVETISSPAGLFLRVSDPLLKINAIRICSSDVLEIVYTSVDDNAPTSDHTNIFVAAYTTSLARLRLYESLEKLGKQALYFDTDSVIFRWYPGQPDIPLGDFLGDMTNELDDGDYITEFVSGGPKNYGYITKSGKVCCKVRGFTLNVLGSAQLNYEVMRQNVLEEIRQPLEERRNVEVLNPRFFTRDPTTKRLRVMPHVKKYGLVFDKRVVDPITFQSFPYGYKP